MKFKFITKIFFFLNFVLFLNIFSIPKLTIIMVIDQFAYSYMEKLGPNFEYAFKDLKEHGVYFTNAHHAHGVPATATGHNALNTGTLAKNHGIIANSWIENGKKVNACKDDSPESSVFGPNNKILDYGYSTKNIMCNGLTDEFVKKYPNDLTFSISYKSRAAIGMSGKTGKPIWFDDKLGIFTTSKAFFNQLPNWVKDFNEKYNLDKTIENNIWRRAYPKKSKKYNLPDIDFNKNSYYIHSTYHKSLISKKRLDEPTDKIGKKNKPDIKNYSRFIKSPLANKVLLDFAKNCIDNNLHEDNNMLLWISLSPLDHLGHIYGPNGMEVTDMIYHLDKQIKNFLDSLYQNIDEEDILFVLTADHGVQPLVELNKEKNLPAYRINSSEMLHKINKHINKKYNIKNLVTDFEASQLYFDMKKFNNLDTKTKESIYSDIKKIVLNKKGISKVVTTDELINNKYDFDSILNFYKQQVYIGRSGQVFIIPNEYSDISNYKFGAGHKSGYECNTHVPLTIYQKGNIENKVITQKVWLTQLPVTIAKILDINKPEKSEFEPIF
ncbi:alkaline phosphatase family protein [Candidatus Dependentiae bacterium]|nr:alkaline phosphatase family protein [Candidatus Dependentiae bacterium]MBU4387485.1 alkaline phosphatase family protein [Candidatus Dependentiae bacterium]